MAFELSLLSSKTPPLVGLDIGSSSVKLVELSQPTPGTFRLERYAIEPLPRGQKGLMAGIGIQGSKITKIDK